MADVRDADGRALHLRAALGHEDNRPVAVDAEPDGGAQLVFDGHEGVADAAGRLHAQHATDHVQQRLRGVDAGAVPPSRLAAGDAGHGQGTLI